MLVTGEIYHILNRGTENRVVFQNKRDYERFLITILECNSIDINTKNRYRIDLSNGNKKPPEDPLVEILCICLMPNHFHMAVKQLVHGGIAKLMQRVGNSYTKYFNIKNNRKGSLFMSRYKAVHVKTDSQMRHLITYIHANPLDLIMPKWRLGKIKDFKKAKDFLENYIWSSYPFYIEGNGLNLISQIINSKMVKSFYPKKEEYSKNIHLWSSRYFEVFDSLDLE
ncbi:transposase [Patescibacteria group bacterium]|nr:transposase [Patescibacteria group bacterium]